MSLHTIALFDITALHHCSACHHFLLTLFQLPHASKAVLVASENQVSNPKFPLGKSNVEKSTGDLKDILNSLNSALGNKVPAPPEKKALNKKLGPLEPRIPKLENCMNYSGIQCSQKGFFFLFNLIIFFSTRQQKSSWCPTWSTGKMPHHKRSRKDWRQSERFGTWGCTFGWRTGRTEEQNCTRTCQRHDQRHQQQQQQQWSGF